MLLAVVLAALLGGCAAVDKAPADPWPALREARPASVLVLPPVNDSPDVQAPGSVMAQAVLPLAERGYYVFPVALSNETLRVRAYGSVYRVISADSVTTVDARLVDLRDGRTLWTGSASASSAEQRGSLSGGLSSLLLQAIVEQVASSLSDRNHAVAGVAMSRLLASPSPRGLPPGPRASPSRSGARP
jgi:hypothetical protein